MALAFSVAEFQVFRPVLYAILFSVALGQNVSLLCNVLCGEVVVTGCHAPVGAPEGSNRLIGGHDCGIAALVDTYVKEDVRRTADSPQMDIVLAVARDQFPQLVRVARESGLLPRLDSHPRLTTLRI